MKYIPQIYIGILNLFEEVRVVDERGVFDGNQERYRLKVALTKGPVYATIEDGNRIQICA